MDEKLFVHEDDHVLYGAENLCLYSRGAIRLTKTNKRSQYIYTRTLGTLLRDVARPDHFLKGTLDRRRYRLMRVNDKGRVRQGRSVQTLPLSEMIPIRVNLPSTGDELEHQSTRSLS